MKPVPRDPDLDGSLEPVMSAAKATPWKRMEITERKREHLAVELEKLGCLTPEITAVLMNRRVDYLDNGQLVAVDESGKPLKGVQGPMGLSEFIPRWRTEERHYNNALYNGVAVWFWKDGEQLAR